MRTIDADALKSEIVKSLGINDRKYLLPAENAIWKIIDKMPTIEPERKPGKWIIYVISPFDGEGCKCSECGFEGAPYWGFCPNCGSYNGDMRQEGGQ